MRSVTAIALFVSGVPLATVTANCVLADFNRVETAPLPSGGGGAGGEGGEGGAGGVIEPCVSAQFPLPPNVADAGGDIEFVTAARTVTFAAGAAPLGVDLDRECTCLGDPPGPPTCVAPDGAEDACDLEGGRDNAFAGLAQQLALAIGVTDLGAQFSQGAEAGEWSALLRIQEYNGEANDDVVRVALYPTPGLGMALPLWDGTDAWPIVQTSLGQLMTPDDPLYFDAAAYVTDGVLVASLPTTVITLQGGLSHLEFRLTGGGLSARIVDRGDGTYALDEGMIAGRWESARVFEALGTFRDETGSPLCTDDVLVYSIAKAAICNSRDILAGIGGPTVPCDAVSFAMGFTSEPALLGAVVPPPMPTPGCPPETNPATQTCN